MIIPWTYFNKSKFVEIKIKQNRLKTNMVYLP